MTLKVIQISIIWIFQIVQFMIRNPKILITPKILTLITFKKIIFTSKLKNGSFCRFIEICTKLITKFYNAINPIQFQNGYLITIM